MTGDKREAILKRRLEGLTYKTISLELGISRQRVQQLISPPRFIRELIVTRAAGKCQRCGINVGKSGHVHHAGTEYEDYNDVENLQLLCVSCHRLIHNDIFIRKEKIQDSIRLILPQRAANGMGISINRLWELSRDWGILPVWRSYIRNNKEINVKYFLSSDLLELKSIIDRLKEKAMAAKP